MVVDIFYKDGDRERFYNVEDFCRTITDICIIDTHNMILKPIREIKKVIYNME